MTYKAFIQREAAIIKSDGCTKATEWFQVCCWEHDLAYYYARDPRDAYRQDIVLKGNGQHWITARPIGRKEADLTFRRCHEVLSYLKDASLMAKWRFWAVRLGGWWAWRKHRMREKNATR